MKFKSIPWWLWIVPILMLFVATDRMPYGYYTFLRITICGFAGFLAYLEWEEETAASRTWAIIFALVAILFNPILPVYLTRATWSYLDVGSAMVFVAHLVFARLGWLRPRQERASR